MARWSACAQMSFLLLIQVGGAFSFAEVILRNRVMENFVAQSRLAQILFLIVLISFVYRVWGDRWEAIIDEFEKSSETKRQKLLRTVAVNIYQLAWIAFTVICLFLLRHRNALLLQAS